MNTNTAEILSFEPIITGRDDEKQKANFHEELWRFGYEFDEKLETRKQIPTESLYPLSESLSPLISKVFRLLEKGMANIEESLESLKKDDLIASDDAIQHLIVTIAELFCCRSIGEGFAATINAVLHSILNKEGDPLNFEEIIAIKSSLNRLQTEPFLEFNDSLDLILKLEKSGLTVEPKHLNTIIDFF